MPSRPGVGRGSNPPEHRGAGVALVALNMLVQLAWMPAYPIWSIILLGLDVFVLYALIVTREGSTR